MHRYEMYNKSLRYSCNNNKCWPVFGINYFITITSLCKWHANVKFNLNFWSLNTNFNEILFKLKNGKKEEEEERKGKF